LGVPRFLFRIRTQSCTALVLKHNAESSRNTPRHRAACRHCCDALAPAGAASARQFFWSSAIGDATAPNHHAVGACKWQGGKKFRQSSVSFVGDHFYDNAFNPP